MPYKVQLVQKLKPIDHPMCFRFAKWACDRLSEDADFGKKNFFSVEAHSNLVNKESCRIWGTEKTHAYIEKPTHPKRALWRWFWSSGIIEPFFFENEQGVAFTVNLNRYQACWTNFCSQKLRSRILAIFCFTRTALRAKQPKLTSMFFTLFGKSHYQLQSWCHLATSELWFATVEELLVGCRQR